VKRLRFVLAVISGRLDRKFALLLFRNFGFTRTAYPISLFVTAQCSIGCKECIMRHLMRDRDGYQMSLEEIRRFIDVSEKSRFRFDIVLTGGEPLEWIHFKEGVRLLCGSKICQSLVIFSNARKNLHYLDKTVMDLVTGVRLSKYAYNEKEIITLKEQYPEKIWIVSRENFWVNPKEPVPDSLPAKCLNPEALLLSDCVYACPHSASIAVFNGSGVRLANPLAPGFLKGLASIKKEQQSEICAFCISNQKVRRKVLKIKNISQKLEAP
jgi:organic radical activating enzyme